MEHRWAQFRLTIQDGCFGRIIFTKQSDPCTGLQQTLRVSGGWGSQILRHWHMKVVRLSALRTSCLIPQEIFLVRIPVRSQVDPRAIVWPEDRSQWKIPMILSKIKPTTFHSAAPQPAAPPCGSTYSSLSRHSNAIGPQTQYEYILVSMLLYQQVTGFDYGSQKLLQDPSQSEPWSFILISKTKCNTLLLF